jgi:diguanylate cyclase
MRVISCIIHDHNLWFVLVAAILCLSGSLVSSMLIRRTFLEEGISKAHWCFLSAVTAGAATWTTHFIAMLGYEISAPVSLEGALTVLSALVAVAGIGLGLFVASLRRMPAAPLLGGAAIGLAIASMHYIGMFAYRVDGVVRWDTTYIAASLILTTVLSALAIKRLRAGADKGRIVQAGTLLALAIAGLHFTGMAAFAVTPMPGYSQSANSEAFATMAAAIGLVALLIVGTGISTYLLERKTNSEGETRIAHIAMHDSLTDLANRRQFTNAIRSECEKLKKYGRPFSLLMIDLDRFKPINDTLGHPVGDEVLRRVSKRLRFAVRNGDMVARIGGDEFAVISYGINDEAQAGMIAERIVELLSRPMIIQGNVVELSACVGVAVAPEHGTDPDQLAQHADVALYSAKHNGKQTHRFFDPSLMEAIQRKRALEASLRRACMRDEFTIVYQPVFNSDGTKICAAEALLRWKCPERGDISPSEFIPIAEELGLVSRIGSGVLRQACMDAASWPVHIGLAVNVSPVQLLDPRLPQIVRQALDEASLSPERLELEITETALLNNDEAALKVLRQIRGMGVRISLDDFGTGYSSLSYLHRFPISRIKIDKSFIQRLPDDVGSASIVRAIALLGDSLSLEITAEGIETNSQLNFIRDHGCDHVQGFLTGHPVSAEAFLSLTRSEKAVA